MRQMAVPPGSSAAEQAELFSRAIFDAWGVGHQACDDGVLLLLSTDDRQASAAAPRLPAWLAGWLAGWPAGRPPVLALRSAAGSLGRRSLRRAACIAEAQPVF